MIDVPADDWRWAVANWPHDRWVAWRRRVGELLPEGAGEEEIQAADRLVYDEMTAPGPFAGVASGESPFKVKAT